MRKLRLPRVITFLVLTFALSWGAGAVIDRLAAERISPEPALPPLGMFVPATVALLLRHLVFRDSPIHHRVYRERPRWIVQGFLALVAFQATLIALWLSGTASASVLTQLGSWSMIGWTLLIIRLYRRHGEASFRRAGLQLGNTNLGAWFVVAIVVFFVIQAAGDLAFDLGHPADHANQILGIEVPSSVYPIAMVVLFGLAVVGTPLGGLAVVFGEEYGWRGFLHDELAGIGRRTCAIVVGLIWGAWHLPIILSGVHTYSPTALGVLLATYCGDSSRAMPC
jgi:membrane protease YdiL (CAAX protease family)